MAKSKELSEFRAKHFKELEKTLAVLKTIRDDEQASARDRNEACKSIGRLLSAMSPAKPGEGLAGKAPKDKPTLSAEHAKVLDDILGTT